MIPGSQALRPSVRIGPFGTGVLTGLALFVASLLAVYLWLNRYPEPEFNVEVSSNGADISRHGGQKLLVRHAQGSIVQTCNGACDDLRYSGRDDEDTYFISILGPAGQSIVPERGLDVMGGFGALSAKFDIGGANRLEVKLYDRISELPWKPAEGVAPR